MPDLVDAFWQQPPIARTLAAAVVVISVGCHFHLIPYQWFYFDFYRLLRIPPEIWRPVTSFLLSSPGLGIILDPYFLFQYLSKLEVGNPKFPRKVDLVWYLFTVGTIVIALNQFFTGNVYYLQALTLALCYTAVQDERGQQANFFFFTVPAQLVPYCMLLVTLLVNPGMLPLQITGLFAAHLHDFLTRIYPEFAGGPNVLATPSFLSRIIETPVVVRRDYGTAYRSRPSGGDTGRSTGASTGGSVLPDSWKTRGAGHRLG